MPVAILESPFPAPPPSPPRKVWTRSECERLRDVGVLNYDDLELIEGELIDTVGKGHLHSFALLLLRDWLAGVFGLSFVWQEIPVDVAPADNSINEPEPDLAVTSRPFTEYTGKPSASDLRLVVEIAHTSLAFDRTVKARLYARAEIAESWIVDVAGRQILVHRDPREGLYRSIAAYREDETIASLAAPDSALAVRQALPPAVKG